MSQNDVNVPGRALGNLAGRWLPEARSSQPASAGESLAGVKGLFGRVGRGVGAVVGGLVILAVIIVACAELGWLVGWTAGEVARVVMTKDLGGVPGDFGQAFSQQLTLPGAALHAIRQAVRL